MIHPSADDVHAKPLVNGPNMSLKKLNPIVHGPRLDGVSAELVNHEHNEFIWLRRFSSEAEIEELEAAYFASPERQALGDRPQQLIQHMDIKRLTPDNAAALLD